MSITASTFKNVSQPMSNVRLGIIIATLVLTTCAILTFITFTRSISESDLAKHNRAVESSLDKVFSSAKDGETAMRGYLMTSEINFLEPLLNAKKNLAADMLELEDLLRNNSEQHSKFQELKLMINGRFQALDSIRNLFESKSLNANTQMLFLNQGRLLMQSLQNMITQIKTFENSVYLAKYNTSGSYAQTARTIITIFSITSLLIIIITFYFLFKNQNDIADREMKYRRIFELSPDIIYQLDNNLKISEINSAITTQLGYQSESLINSNLGELFQVEKNTQFIENTIRQGLSISNMEIELKHLDGRSINFLLNLYADNSTKSFQGSLINITERIRIEREKNALEKFAGIGKIARIIAHEVRNPLTNINLSVDSLKNNSDPSEIDDFLGIIDNNSKRINKLITELLYTTKVNIENARPISINKLLDDTLELAKDRIRLKGIQLVKNYEGTCALVGDDQQLQMAFLNIIINAIEAMNGEKNILTINANQLDTKCVITISDNGKGIKKEDMDNIFEPFFSTKKNGTGLGLATTQIIILLHLGTIEVKSTPEIGTQFIVTFNTI